MELRDGGHKLRRQMAFPAICYWHLADVTRCPNDFRSPV